MVRDSSLDAAIQASTIAEESDGTGTPRPRAARRYRGSRLVDADEAPGTGDTSGPGVRGRYRCTTARINEDALWMLALLHQSADAACMKSNVGQVVVIDASV